MMLDNDIQCVADAVMQFHDRMLSHLCWKTVGRPRSGTLYDERRKYKKDLPHLNKERAHSEKR